MDKVSIQQIWNEELEQMRREAKERDYISATDIGKPFLDRFYKMKGIPETNPFEPRILRILSAGEQFHWLMAKVFERAGLLLNKEQRVEIPATEKTLKVLGYYDLKIGGKVNKEQATQAIKSYGFSPFIEAKALKLVDCFAEKYSEGFEPIICEVKSVHSSAFWNFQEGRGYLTEAYPHYELQLYTYLKALKIKEGRLLLISKDDLSLAEYILKYPTERLEEKWNEDISKMSYYYLNNIEPEKEPDIVFDEEKQRWVENWRVARSPYLTKITGLSKEKWAEEVKEKLKIKNKRSQKIK